MEKYRGRVHMLLLYPDNKEHMEAFEKIVKSYDYASILHNRDEWTIEDEKHNPEHKAGQKKKEHLHVVVRTRNATWNSALCKDIGISEQFCEQARNIDRALQYLLHYNDTDKVQYSIDEVQGSMVAKLRESITRDEKSEGEKVIDLIEFIDGLESPISLKAFASYCASNGYWAEFRRSAGIFIRILDEHNSKFES